MRTPGECPKHRPGVTDEFAAGSSGDSKETVGHDCAMRRATVSVAVIALGIAIVELVRWANRAYVANMFFRGGDVAYASQIADKAGEALVPGLVWLTIAVACFFIAQRHSLRRAAHE